MLTSLLDTLSGLNISKFGMLIVIFVGVLVGLMFAIPGFGFTILSWLFATAPLWLPPVLAFLFWTMWIRSVRASYIASQSYTLLEIKIPREIIKSPRTMELVLSGLHTGSDGNFIAQWWKGQVRPWFSLEIASFGGELRFFVWTRTFYKDFVEAQMYAQFPEVEIYPVEDYASLFAYDPDEHSVWGCDFKLSKADPLPIKTYIDYELDKDPKEELKVDPLAHMLEFLSSLKPGEQVWVQIMIRMNKDKRTKEGTWFEKEDRWKSEAKQMIKDIREDATPKYTDDEGKERPGFMTLNPSHKEQIDAIERSLAKYAFDVGIRGLYIAETDTFRAINITGLLALFKQFGSNNLNGFAPFGWLSVFDYPWQDFRNIRHESMKRGILDAFRRRSWFHPPYETPHYVMTTEELATIFRFPSRTIKAPGLRRTPATKSEPPPNLPI